MLKRLSIRNLAVVEDVEIEFGPGLNVLTGSTGAGKSLILSAVELLSGGRGRRSLIREGAMQLEVEGIFRIEKDSPARGELVSREQGSDFSIRRELSIDGKSRVWLGGSIATLATAQCATSLLMELHGQNAQREFLDPASHIFYLDARGGYEELLGNVSRMIESLMELSQRIDSLERKIEENRRREEYLRFDLRELDSLALEPQLDSILEARIKMAARGERFASSMAEALALLEGEEGCALERLSKAAKLLETCSELDSSMSESAREISEARERVIEVVRKLAREWAALDVPGEDLESMQERLAALQRAMRKHRTDVSGLISLRDQIRNILKSVENGSPELEDALKEREEIRRELLPKLKELTKQRKRAAQELDRAVTAELQTLGMKGASFETRVEMLENSSFHDSGLGLHLSARGADKVEFYIRTNVGERMHPLAEIVSGGELSRISLVLKKLEAAERRVGTIIFDEVDAGLGADLGSMVAEHLEELSRKYQIICVTHLPQVAACASTHIKIGKRVVGGRTRATAAALDREERIAELARMLGGDGKLRRQLAEEMLRT